MKAFGILETEKILQVADKTRLNAVKTFLAKGASPITTVEIQPEASEVFVAVTGLSQKDWFLDWIYQAAGMKLVTLRVTQQDLTVSETSQMIEVVTESQDLLWSKDSDLQTYEADILKWMPEGKSTFNFVHRRAQSLILDWLDEIRVYKNNGQRLAKEDMQFTEDLNRLSTMWALELIFQSLSNRPDDVFATKSTYYQGKRREAQSRGRIQADFNGNALEDINDNNDMLSGFMVRR